MFCDQCGAQLQAGQQFCSRCGKEVKGAVSFAAPPPGRVGAHVRLLGIFWLALSALDAMGGVAALIVGSWVFGPHGSAAGVPSFVRPLVTLGGIFSIVKSTFGFLAG